MERIPLLGEKSIDLPRLNRQNLLIAWMLGLWLTSLALACGLVLRGYRLEWSWALLGLAVIGAVTERQSVSITRNTEVSVSFLPFVFTTVAFGPLAGMAVGILGAFGDFRRPYMRWAVYMPVRAISLGVAGVAATTAIAGRTGFGQILLGSLVASAVNQAADVFFNMLTLQIRGTRSPLAFVRSVGPLLVLSLCFYVPLVALLVYGHRLYSVWIVAIFLLPVLALQRLTQLYQEQRESTERLAVANDRLERASLSFASALVATLDARDKYTAGHSAAVAIYSRDIAARMGLSEDEQRLAHLCGLVHDIGKVGLPPGLLEKSGALTLEERRQMERHSEIGERILSKVEDYAEIARVVRHHHERADGLGYPDGLTNDQIPVVSRIIAVADAYNAMTSDRPYRDAMPSRVARLRLAQAVENQFDTSVVAAFEAILAGASDEYRLGAGATFTFDGQWSSSTRLEEVVTRSDESSFSPGADAELLENVSEMGLYGHFANEQALGYRPVREALGQ
jgi:putative nucleotidyltransferase with HDIG domain